MACPLIGFCHTGSTVNPDLAPQGPFATGISTPINVTLRNLDGPEGFGQFRLYWFNSGTHPSASTCHLLTLDPPQPEPYPQFGVDLPPGGVSTTTVNWTPPSPSNGGPTNPGTVCLFAQAIVDADPPGCSGVDHPNDFSVTSKWNAEHNAHSARVVARVLAEGKHEFTSEFAFGIVNPFPGAVVESHVSARVAEDGDEIVTALRKSAYLRERLDGRRVAQPDATLLALGKERVMLAGPARRQTTELGHSGAISAQVFDALRDGNLTEDSLTVPLSPGELRQGLVRIRQQANANRGDVFVVNISHDVRAANGAEQRGGLVLLVESAHLA